MSRTLYAKNMAGELHRLHSTDSVAIRQELASLYDCAPHRIRLLEEEDAVVPFVVADASFQVCIGPEFHHLTVYFRETARTYYRVRIYAVERDGARVLHDVSFGFLYEPVRDLFVADTPDRYEEVVEYEHRETYVNVEETTPHYASFYELLEADTTLPLGIQEGIRRAFYRKWRRALAFLLRMRMIREGIPTRPCTPALIQAHRQLWQAYHRFVQQGRCPDS